MKCKQLFTYCFCHFSLKKSFRSKWLWWRWSIMVLGTQYYPRHASQVAQWQRICLCGFTPGSRRSCAEGSSNPLHFSCQNNPMDRGDWWLQSMGWQSVGHDWACTHQRCLIPFLVLPEFRHVTKMNIKSENKCHTEQRKWEIQRH